MKELKDNFGRVHDYLRVSVTDKCNLNCFYCNPSNAQYKLGRQEILSYSEIIRIINLFVTELGFKKIRITGGEPFARKNIMEFFEQLSELKKIHPFTLGVSTNGTLLKNNIPALKGYGVDKLNISLDSLDKDKFLNITKGNNFEDVIAAIDEALALGYDNLRVNSVIMRGVNETELCDFVSFAVNKNVNLRFIEFMPFTSNSWDKNAFIPYAEMKEEIQKTFKLTPLISNGITKDYLVNDSQVKIGFISSVSEHFCGTCNRLRITSDGKMKLCLFSPREGSFNLRELIRSNAQDKEIVKFIESKMSGKKFQHPSAEELAASEDNFMRGIGG